MKFVLVGYGSRGDVEPCAAIGVELLRRGHDVSMAVPPNMVGFVESAGLTAVAYGPDSQALQHDQDFVGNVAAKMQNPMSLLPEIIGRVTQTWEQKIAALTPAADGADLLLAGLSEQRLAANVAEYHSIPLIGLHLFPAQVMSLGWLHEHITKEAEDTQRRVLGLPEATETSAPLEIQAYDAICLPELAAEWSDGRRPFVGALTLESPTQTDDDVLAWIQSGTPPVYFGLGSTPIAAPADLVAMIRDACAELGERGLVCGGPNDFTRFPHDENLKVVAEVNHAAVFPACRAVVHHGGSGTTAAALRAGVPMCILWLWLDQPLWAAAVNRLKVGSGRPFSATTAATLVEDLRSILTPECAVRAREIATQMTKPAEGVASAADLLENAASAP